MKHIKLKLSHKGFILIAVPLLCELIFICVLSSLLNQAETIAAKEANSKAVIFQATQFSRKFIEAGMLFFLYKNTGNPSFEKRYCHIIDKLPLECADLKARTANQPELAKTVARIERMAHKAMELLRDIRKVLEEGLSPNSNLLYMSDLNRELEATISSMIEDLQQLVSAEAALVRSDPEKGTKSRALVGLCILIGVILNIAVAIGLTLYFNASTLKRLKALIENTILLSKQQPLRPILDGADEIAQLDRSFHDMAEALQKAADKERAMLAALQTSEARIRSIIESMPVGLVIANKDGKIELVNDRIEQMFGYKSEELLGEHLNILCPQSNSPDRESWLQALEQQAVGRSVEIEARKKDGNSIAVDVSLDDLQEYDSNKLLLNIVDATERHAIEKLKKELVSVVSHDLRTPLTSVQMNLSLMLAGGLGPLPEEIHKNIKGSEQQINRLIKLVKDLLDVEKIESGTFDLQFRKISINVLVKNAIDAVAAVADNKGISIEYTENNFEIYADEDRLVQVLVNLLSNAIKYSNPNTQVWIETKPVNNFLELSVRDTGRGIPKEYSEVIFERFQQVSDSDRKDKGGTGLGLAICKALIQQHGGSIGVESQEGAGSRFWFRLPLSPPSEANMQNS